ncbi:MAG: cell division protein SepF [Oscillospiraceae bacterium]|jgi:cell division inhibitor SepF
MGLFDELKKLTRPYSSEEYDEFGDEYAEAPSEPRAPAAAPEPQRRYAAPPAERRSNPFSDYDAAPRTIPTRHDKVVSLGGGQQAQVVLVKPERFEAAAEIADHIRERRSVVLNLEEAPKDIARRLVDFLSGVAYALDGKIGKVAANTYILTPNNVDVMGDLMDELGSSGVYLR